MSDHKFEVIISKNDKRILTIENTYDPDGLDTHFLELLKNLKSDVNAKLTDLVEAEKEETVAATAEIEAKLEDGKIFPL